MTQQRPSAFYAILGGGVLLVIASIAAWGESFSWERARYASTIGDFDAEPRLPRSWPPGRLGLGD